MAYIKINGENIIKFPYDWADLYTENPFSSYDSRFDLAGWYAQTEEAAATGNSVVEVEIQQVPAHDARTQKILQQSPQLVSGVWTVGYDIIEKTPEEIDQYDNSPVAGQPSAI